MPLSLNCEVRRGASFRLNIKIMKKLALIVSALILTQAAFAQSRTAIASASAGNNDTFGFNSGNISLDTQFSGSGSPVSINHTQSFSGVDGNDDPQTMTLNAEAFASANFGILRASATASIQNNFFSSSNAWYFNPTSGQVNPQGVADTFLIAGSTSFSDVFTYTGLGAGFTVNFFYQVDGVMTGDNPYTNLIVTNNGTQEIFNAAPNQSGIVNTTFITQKYTPLNNQIAHSVQFTSGVSYHTYDYFDGANLLSTADFDSTITLVGMVAYDASGNVATGWSFSAASGADYGAVPEPATMTILALAALIAKKRKK